MPPIDWMKLWEGIRKYLLNKYILTLLIFAGIMLFAGEQSIINRIKRARQINDTKAQVRGLREAIDKAHKDLEILQNKDSLERLAREKYYMCQPDEDVYLIPNP